MGENKRVAMPDTARTFEAPFTDVPGALAEIRAGRMVVVVDDEDRENEGDLTLAAEFVTPEAINFMATLRPRADLPGADRGARRPSAPLSHDPAELLALRHGVYRDDRGARGSDHRHLGRRPGADHPHRDRSGAQLQPTWPAPATSFRCARARAACWCAPGRPRPRSIWRGWPGSIPRA